MFGMKPTTSLSGRGVGTRKDEGAKGAKGWRRASLYLYPNDEVMVMADIRRRVVRVIFVLRLFAPSYFGQGGEVETRRDEETKGTKGLDDARVCPCTTRWHDG
jgi:hypothetical protein